MIETVRIKPNNVELEFTTGPIVVNSITIWVNGDYRRSSRAISVPVPEVDPITNVYTIQASQLGLNSFDGLFFIEFGVPNILEKILVVVGNFTSYYECLLDKVLKTKLKGCGKVESNCKDCDDTDITFISTLLTSLEIAVINSYYKEAAKIIVALEDNCEICHNCPSQIMPALDKYLLSYNPNIT